MSDTTEKSNEQFFHRFELRKKSENELSTGANTELFIDGELARGVTEVNINIKAGGLAEVSVKYIGHVTASVLGQLTKQIFQLESGKD